MGELVEADAQVVQKSAIIGGDAGASNSSANCVHVFDPLACYANQALAEAGVSTGAEKQR